MKPLELFQSLASF